MPQWEVTDYAAQDFLRYYRPTEIHDARGPKSSFWSWLSELDSARVAYRAESDYVTMALTAPARVEPAESAILQRAALTDITLINEAHHLPYHRTFTAGLLEDLYALGYRHLGLEALSFGYPLADSIANAPDPRIDAGFYGRDPEFGHLLREAQRIGFQVFRYDQPGRGKQPVRELGGMRNIMDYRAEHPDGKLLIHCGFAHAREGYYLAFNGGPLAQRLADTLSIDPLTVSQTSFSPGGVDEVSVLEPAYVPEADTASRFDLYVVHPEIQMDAGRPAYKFSNGREARRVVVNAPAGAGNDALLFVLSPTADESMGIPYDVVAIGEEREVTISAPAGSVRLLLYDGSKAWSFVTGGG